MAVEPEEIGRGTISVMEVGVTESAGCGV